MTGVVLLPVRSPRPRTREHHDAGLGTVDARLPGTVADDPLSVPKIVRVLAEVPDVPAPVLRVPVECELLRFSGDRDRVAHDEAVHVEDPSRGAQDDDLDSLDPAGRVALVAKRRPGLEGQVAVVDRPDEVRGPDHRVIATTPRVRGRPGPGADKARSQEREPSPEPESSRTADHPSSPASSSLFAFSESLSCSDPSSFADSSSCSGPSSCADSSSCSD